MENLRIFIGIDLPQSIAMRVASRMTHMRTDCPFQKWTHPDDLHVTLQFLGNTPLNRLDHVQESMKRTAADTATFQLTLTKLGIFGSPDAPRIIWLGLSELANAGSLSRLHTALVSELSAVGVKLDARPFRPHLTLARSNGVHYSAEACRAAWAASAAADPDAHAPLSWTIDRITLFQSHPGRRPSYDRRFIYALGP